MHAGICAMWATRSDALTSEQVLGELFATEEQYVFTLKGLQGVMAQQLRALQPDWCFQDDTKTDLPPHECEVFYDNLRALYETHSVERFNELQMEHMVENNGNASTVALTWTTALANFFQRICGAIQTVYIVHLNRQVIDYYHIWTLRRSLEPTGDRLLPYMDTTSST